MEKTERETHDFMNVQSFSQLPFIRPPPSLKEKTIRLFGKDFGTNSIESNSNSFEETKDNEIIQTTRKFECHYCFRNFPTSQALGGHQNAHKRERQHAKRAHLQSSAMVHGGFVDPHVYRFSNYGYFSSPQTPTMATYPLKNNDTTYSNYTTKFYGGHDSYHQVQQPINGSPLGLWRIPAVQNSPTFNRDRTVHPLPLYANDDLKALQVGGSSSSESSFVYESKTSLQEHVSLDLHL